MGKLWHLDPGVGGCGRGVVAFGSQCWGVGALLGFLLGALALSDQSHPFAPSWFPGQRLVSPGSANETSSILVESVTRSSTETCYSAIPKASSDASKVTSKGAGLSKAFLGQKSSFLVDCSKAGRHPGPARGREAVGVINSCLSSVYYLNELVLKLLHLASIKLAQKV